MTNADLSKEELKSLIYCYYDDIFTTALSDLRIDERPDKKSTLDLSYSGFFLEHFLKDSEGLSVEQTMELLRFMRDSMFELSFNKEWGFYWVGYVLFDDLHEFLTWY